MAALRPPRTQWVDAFSATLMALRPHGGVERTRQIADDLWAELGHFDPVIAAEMEYESTFCDA